MRALMLAAMQSGSGKTAVTCALLAAARRRGLDIYPFKTGPDYIDPMFHTRAAGRPSRNLDLFLQGEEGVRRTLAAAEAAAGDGLALIEGAMGYYDGMAGGTDAGAWAVADALGVPAILVLRPAGQGVTLAAQLCGMLNFRSPSHIAGVLFSGCKASLADYLAPIVTRETGLPVLGTLPPCDAAKFDSRHLGLQTPGEIDGLDARFAALAEILEQNADLDKLLALAADLPVEQSGQTGTPKPTCRIAVARDEAFCFTYADNLDALQRAGAELCFFSPLHDRVLPKDCDALYLCGGYPELHAGALAQNAPMRQTVQQAVTSGMPTVAECGGFLYLGQTLEDADGNSFPMAGALPGEGYRTDRLRRFGYLTLTADADSLLFRKGDTLPAHEFHYWEARQPGGDLTARKPGRGKSWQCCFAGPTIYAGFPHLHFGGGLPLAERFVAAAAAYRRRKAE